MPLRHLVKSAVVAGCALALSPQGLAQAAPTSPAQPSQQQRTQMQQLMGQYQQVTQKLRAIQIETIKANPTLAERHETYQGEIDAALREQGEQPAATRERLKEIRDQIQREDVPREQKQQLAAEFRDARRDLAQARETVMSDPELRETGESLREDTMTAMMNHNEQTAALLQRLQAITQDLQAMQNNAG